MIGLSIRKEFENELQTYGKAKLVNGKQEMCYAASVNLLMNIGRGIDVETVVSGWQKQ